MKDTTARNNSNQEHDVLCPGMEAPELGNDFLCVIISDIVTARNDIRTVSDENVQQQQQQQQQQPMRVCSCKLWLKVEWWSINEVGPTSALPQAPNVTTLKPVKNFRKL